MNSGVAVCWPSWRRCLGKHGEGMPTGGIPSTSRRQLPNVSRARIERLERGSRTVFWLPYFLTDELMGKVGQLARINYLLGNGTGDRLNSLAADWPLADRQQGRVYLQQRQTQLRGTLISAMMQAYGSATSRGSDVQDDTIGVFHTLAEGLHVGDPRGGTLAEAFHNLTGELLAWSYPGRPAMPDDEKPVTRSEMTKILEYARLAAADPARGVRGQRQGPGRSQVRRRPAETVGRSHTGCAPGRPRGRCRGAGRTRTVRHRLVVDALVTQ
ncbi:hypothetical protein MED01_002259 [Micromonospora sp. MED01]|uniref:hypothetical protein n=1 Tax=Micromonospora alfalfae TaxID=2911212 RepID=UPI001EE7DFD6|nr:hypothetical protein [Micromonospora alfalfae]MCG5464096.1 hypothetical protein [Micromonospora alfalfae]